MRIVLDVDGVLADFNNGYADLLELFGAPAIDRTPPWPTVWEWPVAVADEATRNAAWEAVQANPEFFTTLAPTADALTLAGTGELQELLSRHDVYIVTSRPQATRGATEFWLGELLDQYLGSIHILGPKGSLAAALGADLLIDDKAEHVRSADEHGIRGLLVSAPYNSGGESLIHIVRRILGEIE